MKNILLATSERLHAPKHDGDAGYDIELHQDVYCAERQVSIIETDIAIALPEGVWGYITGRSSTYSKRKAIVCSGIIDNGYRGPLKIAIYPTDEALYLKEGERIAQLILMPLLTYPIVLSKNLPETDRGVDGLGSTGV